MTHSPRKISIIPISLLALGMFLVGCIDRELTTVPTQPTVENEDKFLLSQNRDVDILFIVDNSNSMEAEQRSLAENFPRFVHVLEGIQGGLPDVHLGVITTDVGVGEGNQQGTCQATGDAGKLQATPSEACQVGVPDGLYIEDVSRDGARETNYPEGQSLADTFSCIAEVGVNGCGFEQPLESMRKALDPSNAVNSGFLRPDAYLALVFITDEDDCSAIDSALFGSEQNALDMEVGRRGSFRCWEYGVQCDPDAPYVEGVKTGCRVREDSPFVSGVEPYVDFLMELKHGREELIAVAGIIGESGPIEIARDAADDLELERSCGEIPGERYSGAVPATRIEAFLDSFSYSTRTSICDADLTSALDDVAQLLARVIGQRCLLGRPADTDAEAPGLQPECSVTEIRHPGAIDQDERVLPECDDLGDPDAAGNQPCYVIRPDAVDCSQTDSQLEIEVYPTSGRELPTGTVLDVRCLGE